MRACSDVIVPSSDWRETQRLAAYISARFLSHQSELVCRLFLGQGLTFKRQSLPDENAALLLPLIQYYS